jgi:hypothetical protein
MKKSCCKINHKQKCLVQSFCFDCFPKLNKKCDFCKEVFEEYNICKCDFCTNILKQSKQFCCFAFHVSYKKI